MITSILHAKLRDTGQIVNVSTRVGFYFTPVFYTIDMIADSRIPAEYVTAYLIANPMAVYLSISRTLIMGTPLGISTDYILIALVETLVIFIIGSYYYQEAGPGGEIFMTVNDYTIKVSDAVLDFPFHNSGVTTIKKQLISLFRSEKKNWFRALNGIDLELKPGRSCWNSRAEWFWKKHSIAFGGHLQTR